MGESPKDSVIVMVMYQSTVDAELVMNMYDYAEPVLEAVGIHEFLAIEDVVADTTGFRNMSSLAQKWEGVITHRPVEPLHGEYIDDEKSVFSGTFTFANDVCVMGKAPDIYSSLLNDLKTKAKGDWNVYIIYQHIPSAYWKDNEAKGGNVPGLERFKDQVPWCKSRPFSLKIPDHHGTTGYLPHFSWQGAEQDDLFNAAGAELIRRIREYAESIGAD